MKTQLTLKQQAFVEAYLQHGNGSEAYRKAFPAALKWKPHTVAEHASRLLARGNIRAIVQKLREKSQSAAVATRQEVRVRLTAIIRRQDPDADLKDVRQAIETLAKLQGWNAPEKIASLEVKDITIRIV